MLTVRLVEERICSEYAEQTMRCPVHICIGQEAIAAGVCAALRDEDAVMSTHRSHGHYLAKGGDLRAMMAEIYGREAGCCRGKGGSMHLVDLKAGFMGAVPIVGSTIPIATGIGLSSKLAGRDIVSVVFFGEGASEEGVFQESIQYAALKKLPVIYVCENNGFSVNTPLKDRRPDGFSVTRVAEAYGVEAGQGDGNDVLGVYEMARRAVDRARLGEGPSLLEFSTYRWREHCGPNDDHHLVCRSVEDFEQWKEKCPIATFTGFLTRENLLGADEIAQMREGILSQVDEAFAFAKTAPAPDAGLAGSGEYA
ncbi:thiamine pyrophosphate-dependent dehydrogenase E1 component subunit alpha [Pseudodesulfovibrio karagichevae]|uniref:Thiamine pyrophosphate-dependent dehydrogenase E1 component subunit alpha n=1 Tax=Pseudodesulfovibrio karagichevae TaxID=3239305 RepID=A0ABV4K249_9BACT